MSDWWILPVFGLIGAFFGWQLRQSFKTGVSSSHMFEGDRRESPGGFWTSVSLHIFMVLTSILILSAWLFDPNFYL